jgi:cardiolipin synthase
MKGLRGMLREGLTLPNLLSVVRIILAPIFLILYARGDTMRALAAFAAAAATDGLDGLVARALNQRSRLGAYLDPIADKLLAACALFALHARGHLPLWLPLFMLARDGAIFLGAAVLRTMDRPIPVAPTRFGKYATFSLATLVVLSLASEFTVGYEVSDPFVAALGLVAAECIAVSWVQYFLYFVRTARAARTA